MPTIVEYLVTDLPRFEHDCDACWLVGSVTYAGVIAGQDETPCDVYVCPQGGMPTVVIRHGDDGPDYWSGASLADDRDNPDGDPRLTPWLPPLLRKTARGMLARLKEAT